MTPEQWEIAQEARQGGPGEEPEDTRDKLERRYGSCDDYREAMEAKEENF